MAKLNDKKSTVKTRRSSATRTVGSGSSQGFNGTVDSDTDNRTSRNGQVNGIVRYIGHLDRLQFAPGATAGLPSSSSHQDRNIRTEKALLSAIDYLHLNPVRRGLV